MFSKRFSSVCLALVLTTLICVGMGAPALTSAAAPTETATPTAVTITDALGRQVTFAQQPQRIVLSGKALFMIADGLYLFPDVGSRIVAIGKTAQGKLDFIPVIDPDYKNKIILDSQAGAEQIAAAKPDLVILKSSVAESLGKPVETLGIPVVYVDFETPEQYTRDLTTLGQIFQQEARAKALIAFFQERTDRVTKALADLKEEQKPRVLLLYYTEQGGAIAFNVPPLSFIQATDVLLGGGQPVWKDAQLGKGWTKVTLEQIAAWNPDQVYVIAYQLNVNDVVTKLKADPQWQALNAVKQNKLYGFPGDYYSWDQPDPRWILGLTWLAAKINPDRFKDLDMQAEIRTFYKDLYNLDEAAYQKVIQPNLTGDLP